MIQNFKRTVSCILLFAVLLGSISLGVFAETAADTVSTAKIRVFKVGAELSVELSGTPGSEVAVLMLEPGVNLPDSSTDYAEFFAGISHSNTIDLDDEGKYTYKYVARNTGIYTVRARGAEILYTATNNEADVNAVDKIYVEAWTPSGEYSHDDLSYQISISKEELDAHGAAAMASTIAGKLAAQPEGRRTLFIKRDLMPRSLSDNEMWWDDGVDKVYEYLDEFFGYLKNDERHIILDFVYSDAEHNVTSYGLNTLKRTDTAAYNALLSEISGNAEKYPAFRAELAARGYDFSKDGSTPLGSAYDSRDKTTYNYLKFNAVCANYASDYLTRAIYEPARKHFANVKYSEYNHSDSRLWLGRYEMNGSHPNYIGGNTVKAGTHSAPVLYSKQVKDVAYQEIFGASGDANSTAEKITLYEEPGEDFSELQGAIAILRIHANSTQDGAVTPYIATSPSVDDVASFIDNRYRNEMLIHIALHNPERLFWFNTGEGENSSIKSQAANMMAVIDEVNSLVAYDDRYSLNIEQTDLSMPFTLSGMYANGRNVWRITPDNAKVSNFLTSADGGAVVFTTSEASISFPQGTILEGAVSDIGYWVETPKGVTPHITYTNTAEAEEAVITFYNEIGYKADPASEETVDAVASYKGYDGDKMNFIAAKYDENGVLIDIEAKECGIFSQSGSVSFLGIGKNLDTDTIKFFLWEDTTMRPLATNTID